MNYLYLGIDQSYSGFGLVAVDSRGRVVDQSLGVFPLAAYRNQTHRLMEVRKWLADRFKTYQSYTPRGVCMEGYAPGAKFGRELAGELGAIVKTSVYAWHNLDVVTVAPSQVKKYALGKGVGGKNEMLLGVYKRWGVEFQNDNLADAFVMAQICRAIDDPETAEHKYQMEILQKLSA